MELQDHNQSLKSEAKENDAAVYQLNAKLEIAGTFKSELTEKFNQGESELQRISEERKGLSERMEQLESQLRTTEGERRKAEKKFGKQQRAASLLAEREEVIRNQLFETRQEMKILREENQQLTAKVEEMGEHLEELQAHRSVGESDTSMPKSSLASSGSFSSRSTQTVELANSESLAITRVLIGVEKMTENCKQTSRKMKTVNAKLQHAHDQKRRKEKQETPRSTTLSEDSSLAELPYINHQDQSTASGHQTQTYPAAHSSDQEFHAPQLRGKARQHPALAMLGRKPSDEDFQSHSSKDSGVGLEQAESELMATMQAKFQTHPRVLFGGHTQPQSGDASRADGSERHERAGHFPEPERKYGGRYAAEQPYLLPLPASEKEASHARHAENGLPHRLNGRPATFPLYGHSPRARSETATPKPYSSHIQHHHNAAL